MLPVDREHRGREEVTLGANQEVGVTRSRKRIKVALYEPANVGALIILAHFVLVCMTGNSWFPNPAPPLATIKSALAKLEKLNAEAQGGPLGSRAKRDDARDVLVSHLHLLRAYVQWVAEQNPKHAEAIIESSGFGAGRRTFPGKALFDVLPGEVSGSVRIVALSAGKVAAYECEYSVDGGKTWLSDGVKVQTTRTIPGLRPGKTYLFRQRVTRRGGPGDWCDPVAFLVR